MKILLINPPYAATEPPQMPMGILYIGAALEEAGHHVSVLDLLVNRSDREAVIEAVEDFGPEMVGATSVTMNWPVASQTLRWVKEAFPEIKTVAGGPHVTFTWEEIGKEEEWVDYLVLGEGERTAIELADALYNRNWAGGIAGLAWRENGGMISGPVRGFEKNIMSLPKPARHLFPLSRYRTMEASMGVTTGRGCPFSCIFCVGSQMVGRTPRLMEPVSVAEEVENLVKLGFHHIAFSDDHFGMKRSHAFEVCDHLISKELDINLSIFIRADAADPKLFEKMRQAGCTRILYGVESGNQEIIDRIKKKTNLKMLKEKVKLALDMGFQVQASFILGLPGETPETVKQTFDFAHSLGTYAGMHVLAPLPGSEVCEQADEYGIRILHKDWRRYDANHVVAEPVGISAEELKRIVEEHDRGFEYMDAIETEKWKNGQLSGKKLEDFERRRRMIFFFNLMKNGFFESSDNSIDPSINDDPYKILVKNAAKAAGVDDTEAFKWFDGAMESDNLTIANTGKKTKFIFADEI